ncbi:MAG: GxxExxY protein [Anaerolineales bacterium]
MDVEAVGKHIVDASIKVHKVFGPGLLESAYQACLSYELRARGLYVENEVVQPIQYNSVTIDSGYHLDMLIENSVIVENKSVEKLLPIHWAQLLTYLRLRDCRLGYLINWNALLLKDGLHRIVNNL